MRFRDLLERLHRVWLWSAMATIAALYAPLVAFLLIWARPRVIITMGPLNHFADPIRWADWTLHMSAIGCLACAAFGLAAGAAYFIGRKLPDYTGIITPPWSPVGPAPARPRIRI